jgi:hypothetical protein
VSIIKEAKKSGPVKCPTDNIIGGNAWITKSAKNTKKNSFILSSYLCDFVSLCEIQLFYKTISTGIFAEYVIKIENQLK